MVLGTGLASAWGWGGLRRVPEMPQDGSLLSGPTGE